MRRQATHSLWPYLGLLLCLFFLSLCATRSWFGADGEGSNAKSRRRQSHPAASVDGPALILNDPARTRREQVRDVPPPQVADVAAENRRLKLLTGMLDDVSTLFSAVRESSLLDPKRYSRLAQHAAAAANDVQTPTSGGVRVAVQEEVEPIAVPPSQTSGPDVADAPATSDEPLAPKLPVEAAEQVESRTTPATIDANVERDAPQVRISDENDRLAIRPRPLARRIGELLRAAREPDVPTAVVAERFAWLRVEPTSLIERLNHLEAGTPQQLAQWAADVRGGIERLYRDPPTNATQLTANLEEILHRSDSAAQVEGLVSPEDRDKLYLARMAVDRRVAIWMALGRADNGTSQWRAAGDRLIQSVSGLQTHMQSGQHAEAWATYLLLDELAGAWHAGPERNDVQIRHLIERVSDRLDKPGLTAAQQKLLATPPLAAFRRSFGDWAAATVDFDVLCKAIEAYESRGGDLYATRVAADARLLALASQSELRQVAEAIDRHYRAANLRLAVTGEFLQRMIPEQPLLAEPVRETIAGAAVAGRSLTETDVRVVLVPDPSNWRIGLQVTGDVAASTSSTSGPATFYSSAHTEYLAKKLVVLTPTGLFSFPAVAGADAENMLRAIDTSFDGIPLIEGLVRSIVINQHEKSERQAMSEVESKVSRKARQRLDSQLDEHLVDVASRVRRGVLSPIVELGLEPETQALETTEDRITSQLRLAAPRQLAAHSPRPFALSDSLLSVQVHQSLLNNFLERLELADRKLTLPELYAEVAARLGRDATVPDDVSRTARIHFARRDPVSVSFEHGRVHVTLSLREVADRRRSFHDFKVHAYYRPETEGLQARLLRDGVIEIDGRALPTGDYMILQGVFVSLFSDSRPVSLMNHQRTLDPRLAGLMISQVVFDEGWLGLALGPAHPRRAAQMTPVQR